jgi:hypothetical protein
MGCTKSVEGNRYHYLQKHLPPGQHVIVRCSDTLKVAHLSQRAGGTTPQHSHCTLGQIPYLVRLHVLLSPAMEHFMVPHTSVPEVHGIQWNPPDSGEFHDPSPTESHGIHWIPPDSTGFHRIPWDSMGICWIPKIPKILWTLNNLRKRGVRSGFGLI